MSSEKHILLVEDDPDLRSSLALVLEDLPCLLSEAPSIERAKELLDEKHFNIIFLDLQLADGNGVSVIEHLEQDPDHQNFTSPIVVLSGAMDMNYMRQYGRRVAKSVNKPFDPSSIMAICRELLSLK